MKQECLPKMGGVQKSLSSASGISDPYMVGMDNMRFFQCLLNDMSAGAVFATLKEEDRPKSNVTLRGLGYNSNGGYMSYTVIVNTNGNITLDSTGMGAMHRAYFFGFWIV